MSHGSGDNNINASPHSQSHFTKNFFTGKDDSMSYVIDALASIIDELKREGKKLLPDVV